MRVLCLGQDPLFVELLQGVESFLSFVLDHPLDGEHGLRRRPIQPLITALNALGVKCSSRDGFPPVTIYGSGKIQGGQTSIVGDISSQFITGLLLACPFAEQDTQIRLTTPLESRPYVDLTLDILKKHKIDVKVSPKYRLFTIPRTQQYSRRDHSVPGDFSSAAFLMVAAAITKPFMSRF